MTKENKKLLLGNDFGDVAVSANGTCVEIDADGNVRVSPASNDNYDRRVARLEVGDKMKDGTIFAGVSPDTGENMFVTPQDAPGRLKWKAAMQYAADLNAHGHKDWKLPTKAELCVLYENRDKGALKGTFNERDSGSDGARWYWSCTEPRGFASFVYDVDFTVGGVVWVLKDKRLSGRVVRAEPRP